jgi:hypothetical protein
VHAAIHKSEVATRKVHLEKVQMDITPLKTQQKIYDTFIAMDEKCPKNVVSMLRRTYLFSILTQEDLNTFHLNQVEVLRYFSNIGQQKTR